MIRKQKATSMRLTPTAVRLLGKLAEKLGLPKAGVLEIAIRRLAEMEKVK